MRRVAVLLILACVPATARAAAPATAGTGPGLWSLDVGMAVLHAPYYAGSRREGTDVFPQLGFTYGTRLQGSIDDGLRWSALKHGIVQAGPVIEYRQPDRFHKALPTRGNSGAIEAGGFVQVDTPVAQIEGRVRHAVNDYDGWSADLSADTGIRIGRVALGGEARLSWADQRFVRGLYGPDAKGRPTREHPTAAPTYLTAGLEGDIGYSLTPRLQLGLLVSYDRFIDAFASPARQRRGITQIGTALTYRFGTAPRP